MKLNNLEKFREKLDRDLDRILKVPGLDSILIGPYDFSASMGKAGQWDDPESAGSSTTPAAAFAPRACISASRWTFAWRSGVRAAPNICASRAT